MQDGIQAASRDEGHVVSLRMQTQFQHRISGITQKLDFTIRKPSTDQADHLMRPPRDGLVPLAQAFADFGRGRQHTEERQGPALRASRAR